MIESLHIDSLAHGGAAVGRAADGRVIFVRGGCPGDVVDAEIACDKGTFVEADIVRIVEPSEDRRVPPCPYFGTCGGCQWQHVSYAAQTQAKRRMVVDSLARVGRLGEVDVDETVTGSQPYGYRNHVEMRVSSGADGKLALGFTHARSDEVVPIDACLLLPQRARRLPRAIAGALRYLSGRGALGIERVGLRVAQRTRDVEIDLWGPPGGFPRQAVARTLADAAKPTVVTRVLVKDARERADAKVEVLSGRGWWREKLGARTYRVSAPSFFQADSTLAETLQRLVLEGLAPSGTDRVLDMYAGVGTFTLPLAEAAGEVVALEGNGSAVRDLRANLDGAGLWADVIPGDAERSLADAGRFDLAVVDPPRSGMTRRALDALAQTGARRVCYVSCDPVTLARDARALTDAGYRVGHVTPVDLFAQSWHVESVAILDRAV